MSKPYSDIPKSELYRMFLEERELLEEIYAALWGAERLVPHLDLHDQSLSRIARLLETEERVRQQINGNWPIGAKP